MRKRTAAASGSQAPMIDVVSVKPTGSFGLRIAFSDGSVGGHDFSSTAARDGEMVRPLKDPAFFARVFVELGALTWPNGFDLDPIALRGVVEIGGDESDAVHVANEAWRHARHPASSFFTSAPALEKSICPEKRCLSAAMVRPMSFSVSASRSLMSAEMASAASRSDMRLGK